MFSRLRIRGPLTDRTLSMGASGRHPRRALFGSLIALTLASPLVWTAPASATPLIDLECLEFPWGGWWNPNFGGPNTSNYQDGTPTIEGDINSGLVLTWTFLDFRNDEDFTFDAEFYSGDDCSNYRVPPADVCFTFLANGWTPSTVGQDSSAYDSFFNGGEGYSFEGLVYDLGVQYEFALSEVEEGITATAHSFRFEWSDASTAGNKVTLTMTISDCEDESGGGSENGPTFDLDLDIDPETFLNRMSAESAALPDTL